MKVSTERLENCQMALTIEVDEERAERALREAARRISKRVRIPGFRPGKAPYEVIRRIFGEEALYNEILDELGEAVYKEALKETGIEPFAPARVEDIQLKPLVMKMVVPLAPVVELGDYRRIRLTPPQVIVGEERVEAALRRIQEDNATLRPVDRPARLGDLAVVDIEGRVKGEVVIQERRRKLTLRADSPFPGFGERLVGMAVGEEREFALTCPEDYADKALAGKEIHFKVLLHELKEKVLPDIDDALARTVGDFETLEELKAALREGLRAQAEQEAEERFAEEVLTKVVEEAKVEFPPVLLERELDEMMEELDRRLKREGLSLDNYLRMKKQSREEFRAELTPRAKERLKRALVLGKVVELEGLKVDEKEVEEEVRRISQPFGPRTGAMGEALASPEQERSLALDLLTRKALQRLVAIAKGELEEEPAPEKSEEEREVN